MVPANCEAICRNCEAIPYYVAEELKSLIPLTELYRRAPVKIPLPKFVTFYNGETDQPAITKLRLSDLYEQKAENPELELVVRQININEGYNEDILKQCESLMGYMRFVNKVRGKKDTRMITRDAVTEAVDECIREGILADFFREHKSEVIDMGIYEFDEKAYERILREESEQDGWEKGLEAGLAQGKAESILELLEELGDIPEELRLKITTQADLDILKKWLKSAAKASSVEEFMEKFDK